MTRTIEMCDQVAQAWEGIRDDLLSDDLMSPTRKQVHPSQERMVVLPADRVLLCNNPEGGMDVEREMDEEVEDMTENEFHEAYEECQTRSGLNPAVPKKTQTSIRDWLTRDPGSVTHRPVGEVLRVSQENHRQDSSGSPTSVWNGRLRSSSVPTHAEQCGESSL